MHITLHAVAEGEQGRRTLGLGLGVRVSSLGVTYGLGVRIRGEGLGGWWLGVRFVILFLL